MLSGDELLRRIEEFRALRRPTERDATGRYCVEGARFVHEALRSRTRVVRAVSAPEMLDAGGREAVRLLRRRVAVDEIPPSAFRRLSVAGEPSGVAAIVAQRWRRLDRPPSRERCLWVAFGEIRSAGNLGTTLRTAVAAGARGALFLDPSADPHDPVAVRASMGAVLTLPLIRTDPRHVRAWARRTGVVVVGSSANARLDVSRMPSRRSVVVMLGCERRGMSAEQRRACDLSVRIPMEPGTSSLNVAVAAGILLFAARGGDSGR